MNLKLKKSLVIFASLVGLAMLCIYPAEGKQAVMEGLRSCGCSVIPSLFPFFVLSKLLTSTLNGVPMPKFLDKMMRRIFGVSGSCFSPLLMSFLGGYPTGVSCIVSQYEAGGLSKQEAGKALLFCNNSGPGFFIAVVGTAVLGSVEMGLMLYLIHIFSALLVGRLFANGNPSPVKIKRIPSKSSGFPGQFIDAVSESCAALLKICGFILFFSVLLAMTEAAGWIHLLHRFIPFVNESELAALLYGALELTGGILRLSQSTQPFIWAAFFMGWGGFCIHFQAMSLWQGAGLRPKGYFLSKLLHGGFSALLASCFASPTSLNLGFMAFSVLLCVFLPEICKKAGRNSLRYAV